MRHKPLIGLVSLSILLHACVTVVPSSSNLSSSSSSPNSSNSSSLTMPSSPLEEALDIFDTIGIRYPYLTDHLDLPSIITGRVTLEWYGEGLTIVQDKLIHPFPVRDLSATLFARLRIDGEPFIQSYPIVFKALINAPEIGKVSELRLTLSSGLTYDDIIYEEERLASSVLYEDVHGTMQTRSIASPVRIRTRGHSTRFMPKKAFRLRYETNVSLLGMKAAKNYILLANYIDHSLVRNASVHYLSRYFPSLYPIDYRFVDVVINNEYQGVYLLTERVEFHPNRLDIDFIPDAVGLDSGYMVELDHPGYFQGDGVEGIDYFLLNGKPYYLKEPNTDAEGYTQGHFNYIKSYLENVYTRLERKEDVSALIDIPNWIDYFLIQEVTKNVDVGLGSSYMLKAPRQPLRFQPLWDFDLALGVANYFESGPEGHWGWKDFDKNDFFTLMMKIPSIYQAFKARLAEFEQQILPEWLMWFNDNEARLSALAMRNHEKWPLNTCEGPWCPIIDELLQVESYTDHLDFITDYIVTRVEWMKNNIR